MHRIRDLLSLEHHQHDGRLVRLDVRVKLFVALAAILAIVTSTRPWLPLGALACCAAFWLIGRTPLRVVLARLAAPLALAGVACLLHAQLPGTTPLWAAKVGPWHVVLTEEGLREGGLIGARVLGSVSVVLVLCMITPSQRIFSAMRWARLPCTWIEIAVLMYRHLFTLFEQATSVLSAQKVRLGYGDYRRSIRSASSLAGIVVLRSLDQAEKSHEAMLARGYEGSLHVPPLPAMRKRDVLASAASVAIIILAYLAVERFLR